MSLDEMMSATLITDNDFQYWVFEIDDKLEKFFHDSVPYQIRKHLDYSPASLEIVEDWILKKYSERSDLKRPQEQYFADCIACYVGETFRKNIGGRWDIELEDESDAYYRVPVLTNYEPNPIPICPLGLVSASTDRRTGNFIRTILERKIKSVKR